MKVRKISPRQRDIEVAPAAGIEVQTYFRAQGVCRARADHVVTAYT
jgi:hypothetical protein